MVWVAAGRSGSGRQAAERRAYEDRAFDVSRCARIKNPRDRCRRAQFVLSHFAKHDLAIRVKPDCRIAKLR